MDAAIRVTWRGWSWFDSTAVGQRSRSRTRPRAPRSPTGSRRRLHGDSSRAQSKTRWRSVGEAGGRLHRAVEQLADGHPAGRLVEDRPEPADERREVRLVTVVQVDLPVPRDRARPGRVRRSSGSLRKVLKTSRRNPSTPRSSQPRTISNWAASHAGCPPVRAPAARPGTCGSRTARASAPSAQPGPPKNETQLFGGSGVAVGVAARTGRATGTSRRTDPCDRRRDATNHGCASLVWFITRSRTTRIPRRWPPRPAGRNPPRVPNSGSTSSWSLTS